MNIQYLSNHEPQKTYSSRMEGGVRTKYETLNKLKSTTSNEPLVSIITVVLNSEKYIEETIKSIVEQTYSDIEYIIIDGGSTDNTLNIVSKYENFINYWLSEPDKGLYDAINKGICLCNGVLIGILNAGDIYTKEAITSVVNVYRQSNFDSIVTGHCKLLLEDQSKFYVIKPTKISFYGKNETLKLPYHTIPHPATFVPSSVYRYHGLYNPSYKIAADYDFLCRCYQKAVPFVIISNILAVAMPAGISSNYYLAELEQLNVRITNGLSKPKTVFLTCFSLFKITIHKVLDFLGLWPIVERFRHGKFR